MSYFEHDSMLDTRRRAHLADDVNPAGEKRPIRRGPDDHMTPVPWVGGKLPFIGTWAGVESARGTLVESDKLCLVCGEHRGTDWIYALFNGEPHDYRNVWSGPPSPTYGHPGCILKAALYCPHLKNQEYPAMTQDRATKLTVDDLKELAKAEKILKRDPGAFASGRAAMSPKILRDKALVR